MTNEFRDTFIYLLACAVNEEKPDFDRVKNVNLKELFHHSKRHSVVAMVAYALEEAGFEKEKIAEFIEEKDKSIRKNILYKNELNEICELLSENKIWHMPLKGALLMDLYPKIGMRQMADLDIYFDKTYAEKVTEFMLSRGYTAVNLKDEMHDVYQKPPFFDIEMHKLLVSKYSPPAVADYYNKDYNKKLKTNHDEYHCEFSSEDYYIYMICHLAKHYFQGGTGIRTFLDVYLFLKIYSQNLNFGYIESECTKIKYDGFEKMVKRLSYTLFSGCDYTLDEQQTDILDFILSCNTYGFYQNVLMRRLSDLDDKNSNFKKLKLKYVFRRILPDLHYMKLYYPILKKNKYLLPFVWVYRLFYKSITNLKGALKELKVLIKLHD